MKILSIGSGSKGNVTYLESSTTRILIDCGLSKIKVNTHLTKYGHTLEEIDAILVTHEHSDHVKGLLPLFNATNAKLYLTEGTFLALDKKTREKLTLEEDRIKFIKSRDKFEIKDIKVESIKVSHDVADPCGFIFNLENKKFVYITDTGFINESYIPLIKNADAYIFESNHDPELEMTCSKPYPTIQRVLSDEGHLSNEDSACVASEIIGPNCVYFFLAHLSDECNTEELALKTYDTVFKTKGFNLGKTKLICLSQEPNKEYNL